MRRIWSIDAAGAEGVEGQSTEGRSARRSSDDAQSSGERPPCMQKIFSSMMAAMGKQLKQSVNVFHSLMLYLRVVVGRGEHVH